MNQRRRMRLLLEKSISDGDSVQITDGDLQMETQFIKILLAPRMRTLDDGLHGKEALDSSVEGFVGEAGVLPLHFAGGGPEVGVRAGGEGEIPGNDADAGEFHGLPGGGVLPDEQLAASGCLIFDRIVMAVG